MKKWDRESVANLRIVCYFVEKSWTWWVASWERRTWSLSFLYSMTFVYLYFCPPLFVFLFRSESSDAETTRERDCRPHTLSLALVSSDSGVLSLNSDQAPKRQDTIEMILGPWAGLCARTRSPYKSEYGPSDSAYVLDDPAIEIS